MNLRRDYGNKSTLTNSWEEALVRQAFTPCLQFQYAAKKNTSDIALALDALEVHFDRRAEIFCLVTSDSDFAYLCRRLLERGASVFIVGESKTPEALRNACDQFFEWTKEATINAEPVAASSCKPTDVVATEPHSAGPVAPIKRRPRFVVEAVSLLAASAPDGKSRSMLLARISRELTLASHPMPTGTLAY